MQNIDFWMRSVKKKFHVSLDRKSYSELRLRVEWEGEGQDALLSRKEARTLAWTLLRLTEDMNR